MSDPPPACILTHMHHAASVARLVARDPRRSAQVATPIAKAHHDQQQGHHHQGARRGSSGNPKHESNNTTRATAAPCMCCDNTAPPQGPPMFSNTKQKTTLAFAKRGAVNEIMKTEQPNENGARLHQRGFLGSFLAVECCGL